MIELNVARPTADQRTGVQILNATDANGFQRKQLLKLPVIVSVTVATVSLHFGRDETERYAHASSTDAGAALVPLDRCEMCR